jgi:hypothetical protein
MATTANIHGTWWDTSTGKESLKTLVRGWFDSTEREALVEWKGLCKDLKTSDEFEREARVAGLGAMQEMVEGQNIPLEEAKFGQTKDFTQVAFGNGFRITDRMRRFNKIKLLEKLTRSLKKTMIEGKDIEIAKMWNNMTTTTAPGCTGFVSTLALASNSQTCLDDASTTYDNYGDADLATGSYEAALEYFDKLYDDQGNIFVGRARKLVVCPALRVKAYQITGADKKPFEQSNTKYDLNSYFGFDVVPSVYHRFSGSTAWVVLGDVNDSDYGPRVYTALEPDLETKDGDDRTRDTVVTSIQYFKYGFTDPRLVYCGNQ